jgi:hypothetical protein
MARRKSEELENAEVEGAVAVAENAEAQEAVESGAGDQTEQSEKGGKRFNPPDGYVTPSGFVHTLKRDRDVEVKPQQIYGYCKNNTAWKEITTTEPTYHFDEAKGLELWDEIQERKRQREAKKAESETTENAESTEES